MSGRYALVSRMRNGAIVSWALAWVLACGFAMGVLWYELGESFDSKLQETAQLLLSIAARAPGGLSATDGGDLRARTGMRDHEEYVVYQILDREGRLVLASHEAPEQPLAPLRPGFMSTSRWRIYTEVEPARGLWVQVADRHSHRLEGLRHAMITLMLPLALVMPLAAWLIGRWLGRAMQPLVAMAQALAQRGSGDLSPLPSDDQPQELAQLANSMNSLMSRLDRALRQEREFASQAAHELRTPLAAAIAQVQLLGSQAEGSSRQRLARVAQRLQQLVRTVELLLQWSRAEAGVALAIEPVDLARVVQAVVSDIEPVRQRALTLRLPQPAVPVLAHVDSLGIVLANLLSNAWRHGGEEARVELSVGQSDARTTVTVTDDGPGASAEVLATLGRRIERTDRSRSGDGLGLGLTLSSELAAQMGADLRFVSPAPGQSGGFAAILTLQADVASNRPALPNTTR